MDYEDHVIVKNGKFAGCNEYVTDILYANIYPSYADAFYELYDGEKSVPIRNFW